MVQEMVAKMTVSPREKHSKARRVIYFFVNSTPIIDIFHIEPKSRNRLSGLVEKRLYCHEIFFHG